MTDAISIRVGIEARCANACIGDAHRTGRAARVDLQTGGASGTQTMDRARTDAEGAVVERQTDVCFGSTARQRVARLTLRGDRKASVDLSAFDVERLARIAGFAARAIAELRADLAVSKPDGDA